MEGSAVQRTSPGDVFQQYGIHKRNNAIGLRAEYGSRAQLAESTAERRRYPRTAHQKQLWACKGASGQWGAGRRRQNPKTGFAEARDGNHPSARNPAPEAHGIRNNRRTCKNPGLSERSAEAGSSSFGCVATDWRKAYTSNSSASETCLSPNGGIWPLGARTRERNCWVERGVWAIFGGPDPWAPAPRVIPSPSPPWQREQPRLSKTFLPFCADCARAMPNDATINETARRAENCLIGISLARLSDDIDQRRFAALDGLNRTPDRRT